jgi:hypothetical protein
VRRLTQRLEKARDATKKPGLFELVALLIERRPWEPDVTGKEEEIEPEREGLEQRAMQGDINAVADLLRRDLDYLKTPHVGAIVRSLQMHMVQARTAEERSKAMAGLRKLVKALLPDLRGQAAMPHPGEVALVYHAILQAYQAIKRGEPPREVNLPRDYWPDEGPCPPNVRPAGPYRPAPTRVTLLPSPVFVIPREDICLLRNPENPPHILAVQRTAEIFGQKTGEHFRNMSVEHIRKYITEGRKRWPKSWLEKRRF